MAKQLIPLTGRIADDKVEVYLSSDGRFIGEIELPTGANSAPAVDDNPQEEPEK